MDHGAHRLFEVHIFRDSFLDRILRICDNSVVPILGNFFLFALKAVVKLFRWGTFDDILVGGDPRAALLCAIVIP